MANRRCQEFRIPRQAVGRAVLSSVVHLLITGVDVYVNDEVGGGGRVWCRWLCGSRAGAGT